MPKTTKKFDYEVYDKYGDFVDILSMTRDEAKRYKQNNPDLELQTIINTERNDGRDLSCDING